jgi:hypothetical protein
VREVMDLQRVDDEKIIFNHHDSVFRSMVHSFVLINGSPSQSLTSPQSLLV